MDGMNQFSGPSMKEEEKDARLYYTEAAVVIDKIIRTYSICDDGKRIAWRSAKMIQRAIDDGRNR